MVFDTFLYTISIAYITKVLLLDNPHGPFPSKLSTVLYPDGRTRSVNLFDYLRRLFGVYKISGFVWEVKSNVALWFCPYCLSFWINLIFLPFFILIFIHTYYFVLLLFFVPFVAGKLNE